MKTWVVLRETYEPHWDGDGGNSITMPVAVRTTEIAAIQRRDELIEIQKIAQRWDCPTYEVEGPIEVDGEDIKED